MLKKFLILVALCAYAFGGCDSKNIKQAVEMIQKTLPMAVDKYTIVEKISCKDDYLVYEASVKSDDLIKFEEVDKNQKDKFLELMGEQIKSMCPHLKGALKDELNGIKYIYVLENGDFFGDVKLESSQCK